MNKQYFDYTSGLFQFKWKYAFVIFAFIFSQAIHPLISNIGYLVCVFFILKGKDNVIKALSLSVLITFLNPGAFPKASLYNILRWLVLISAFGQSIYVYLTKNHKLTKWMAFLSFFILHSLLGSFFNSFSFATSVFKLISFFMGVLAIEFSYTNYRNFNYSSWFYTLFIVCLFLSLPLIIHPLGYFKNSTGFQGILAHPNTYGVYMAPYVGWILVGSIFIKNKKEKFFNLTIGLIGVMTLIASESRTSIFAIIIATIFSIFLLLKKKKFSKSKPIVKALQVFLFLILISTIVFLLNPNNKIVIKITEFAIKRQDVEVEGLGGAVLKSRNELIETSMYRFSKSPLIGNGFGMPSDISELTTNFAFGIIPISSSVEKGFAISAILEDTGALGFLLIIFFLTNFYSLINKSAIVYLSAMFWTSIFVTLGEMIFFAVGGLGLHIFLLMSLARNTSYRIYLNSLNDEGDLLKRAN